MKKSILICLISFNSIFVVNGQIYTPGGLIQGSSNNNNIGIGTNIPSDKLQIGDFKNVDNLKINLPGTYNFEQVRLGQYGNGSAGLEFVNHTGITDSYGIRLYSNTDNGMNGLQIQTANSSSSYQNLNYVTRFAINLNGNIGIGTMFPAYKLDVIGTIRAREIKVDMNGADFVFENGYKLIPLIELEKFVKERKHLPEIAPAKEMKVNGTDLGEMNSKLLQKIEEMTLYIIDQNKKMLVLEQKVRKIEESLK